MVKNIQESTDPYLHHVGHTLIVFSRQDEDSDLEVKIYQGLNETKLFSQQIMFRPSMLYDHISSGYDFIFKGKTNIHLTYIIQFHVVRYWSPSFTPTTEYIRNFSVFEGRKCVNHHSNIHYQKQIIK